MPCSLRNLIKYSREFAGLAILEYGNPKPSESNHLLTVRGATLQILATCPVVKTSSQALRNLSRWFELCLTFDPLSGKTLFAPWFWVLPCYIDPSNRTGYSGQ